ncbi:unnamed protein product [Peniophora sp. CBMAI 1063]|nr:unnamed protein product [Peniophora sp. CBMAI 1063]
MASSQSTPAHIRKATKADLNELSLVLARSFARDPFYNWIKGATHMISSANTQDPKELKALEQFRYLQWSLAHLFMSRGEVDVVVIHVDGRQKIVASTAWVGPGKSTDITIVQMLRMRLDKVYRAWGLGAFKRMLADYVPRTEKAAEQAFKDQGKVSTDAWHLLNVSTDPDYEGRGYTSMMLRARFKAIGSLPVYLEASNPKARDIYLHYGFQLVETVILGEGKVDADGLTVRGEKATGTPDFVMIKSG